MCTKCGKTGRNCQWPHGSAPQTQAAGEPVVSCPSCGTSPVDRAALAPNVRRMLDDSDNLRRGLRRTQRVVDAARAALQELKGDEVFVKSRQRVKVPDGEDLFDAVVAELEQALRQLDGEVEGRR